MISSHVNNVETAKIKSWYVLYTRSRCEKKVARELTCAQVETFLPMNSVIKTWSDRKKLIKEPLFPSYVFVYANAKERLLSLKAPGVVRMVCHDGRPARIPESQIDAVRRILECGYAAEDYPYLSKGEEVEIVCGPLAGLKGFVVEKRGSKNFIVSVDHLNKSVLINIDARILKRISRHRTHVRNVTPAAYT